MADALRDRKLSAGRVSVNEPFILGGCHCCFFVTVSALKHLDVGVTEVGCNDAEPVWMQFAVILCPASRPKRLCSKW